MIADLVRRSSPHSHIKYYWNSSPLLTVTELRLSANISLSDSIIAKHLIPSAGSGHMPILNDIGSIRDLQGRKCVLLRQENRRPICVDLLYNLENLLNHQRRQAQRRLIEQ